MSRDYEIDSSVQYIADQAKASIQARRMRELENDEYKAKTLFKSERALVGAIIEDEVNRDFVRSYIQPNDFTDPKLAYLYDVACGIFDTGLELSIFTVQDKLATLEKLIDYGGFAGISEIVKQLDSFHETHLHCEIVHRESRRRSNWRALQQGIEDNDRATTEEEIEIAQYKVLAALEAKKSIAADRDYQIGKISVRLYEEAASRAEQKADNPKIVFGVPTPFTRINKITGGMKPGDLWIVAARPSVGKTSVALQSALRAALDGIHVAFLSTEMTEDALTTRCISNIAAVDSRKIDTSDAMDAEEWGRWAKANDKFWKMPLHFYAKRPMSPAQIASKLREWKRKHGDIGLIIVDYLQTLTPDRYLAGKRDQNRNNEVGAIVKALKDIAMDHRAPMILLSQLNRAVDTREGNRPVLADLRDSGEIEAEADVVVFPYRPSYYKPDETIDSRLAQEVTLIVAKNRNGFTGDIPVSYVPLFGRWGDWNEMGQLGDSHVPDTIRQPYAQDRDESDERY